MTFIESVEGFQLTRPSDIDIRMKYFDESWWKCYQGGVMVGIPNKFQQTTQQLLTEIKSSDYQKYKELRVEFPEEFV